MIDKDQVKLVVTDEDGTFLDLGGEDFSRVRFRAVFDRMRAAGCRFAVATSNQSFQVSDIFGDMAPRLSIIASNGAYVEPEGAAPRISVMPPAAVESVLAAHAAHPEVPLCAVCAQGAFVERGGDPGFVEEMTMYSHNMVHVGSLAEEAPSSDVLMYWSRVNEDELTVELFSAACGHSVSVVDSGFGGGFGYFDVVQPGVSKATGIRALMDTFGINASQVMAFGDAGNDADMLRLAGTGVAMGNAQPPVKAAANYLTADNDHDGVGLAVEKFILNEET